MIDKVEQIKEKLKKLIAKEESAREIGNQAEAEAFANKIQELLLQYELDIRELQGNTAESTIIAKERFDTEPLTNRHESDWIRDLYAACCHAAFCEVLYVGGGILTKRGNIRKTQTTEIIIVGTDMNREMLHYMCAQLMTKVRTIARIEFSNYDGQTKRNTFLRSFYKGACAGISTNLRLRRRFEQENNGQVNALVLDKMGAVKRFMEKEFGNRLGEHKARKPGASDAFMKGHAVGQNLNVDSERGSIKGNSKLLGQ